METAGLIQLHLLPLLPTSCCKILVPLLCLDQIKQTPMCRLGYSLHRTGDVYVDTVRACFRGGFEANLDVPITVEEHIPELEISVDDLVSVQVAGRLENLQHVPPRLVLREALRLTDQFGQGLGGGRGGQKKGEIGQTKAKV